jgi:hypothetical protein
MVAIALAATIVVWLILWAGLRDARKAGLVASLGVIFFYTAGTITQSLDHLCGELSAIWVKQNPHLPPNLVISVEAVLLLIAAYLIVVRLQPIREWTSFLNVFALVAVALPTVSILHTRMFEPGPAVHEGPLLATAPASEQRPDIYYIILDGFARADVMKENFNLDIEPFLDHLRQKGFFVARNSTSNYCQTPLSIASSLNCDYLDKFVDPKSLDTSWMGELIPNGSVVKTLRHLGYTFVSYASGFDQTEQPEGADVYLTPFQYLSNFHRLFLVDTPFRNFLPHAGDEDGYTTDRKRIDFLLKNLPEVAKRPEPTFTFAHIRAPHPPFVFGSNGEDISPHGRGYYLNDGDLFNLHDGDDKAYVQGYRGQAEYIARELGRTIDRLLAASPEPPIILIQSDHGSGLRLFLEDPEATDMWERMCITNAYLFPGRDYQGLDDEITPVNSFRVVFNTFFGSKLPRLPDRAYFSTWGVPFRFIDVTDRVRAGPPRTGTGKAKEGGDSEGAAPQEGP